MGKQGFIELWTKYKGILKWFLLVTYAFLLYNIGFIVGGLEKIFVLLTPFVCGFCIAYILNPLVNLIEKGISKIKLKVIYKRRKGLSLIFGYVLLSIFFFAFILLVVPELLVSVNGLIKTAPDAIRTLSSGIVDFLNNNVSQYTNKVYSEAETIEVINKYTTQLITGAGNLLPQLFEVTKSFTGYLMNFVLGYIISIYMLLNKESYLGQVKKIITAYTTDEQRENIFSLARESHRKFSDFISIKILDSFLVGILCYIGCLFIGIDDALLIAFVVGVTNIIPYFGPFIGAIPTALIVLFDSPIRMFIYILFILALQQFEGNFLEPKLLGDKLGLNSLLVIFAVIMMTGILGVVGMFVGVPIFAIIYMYLKRNLDKNLEKKGKSCDTKDYM